MGTYVEIPTVGRMHCIYQNLDNIYELELINFTVEVPNKMSRGSIVRERGITQRH